MKASLRVNDANTYSLVDLWWLFMGKVSVPLELEKEGNRFEDQSEDSKRDKQLKDINGNKVEVFV